MDTGPAGQQIARITVAAAVDYLAAALAFLREATSKLGLEMRDIAGLERAVEEVCLNVIEHAFEPGERSSFDMVLLRQPGQLLIAVEDQGLPFDFKALEVGRQSSLGGMSLTAFADAVRFASLGNRGNRVEIVKRLPFKHVEGYLAEEEKRPKPPAAPAAPDTPVTLRLMGPGDAVAVARCTYHCYGYTVPDDYLYFPERMREMLEGGLLEACVGVTAEGEVVSCLTLEVDDPGAAVGYLGEAMVDPRFRGHGLFEQMKTFLKQHAAAKGMLGLCSEAVTVHPFSQKGNIALGACETGVQLGDEAPTVLFKQIEEEAAKKRTATILYYLKASEEPSRVVYPPAHHRAMIERIYEHGHFQRELDTAVPAGQPALPASSRVKVEVFPEWSEASMLVTAYGRDLPDLVRFRLHELCLRRIDWIAIDLPLSHPGAQHFCAPLEALGFFFAGVIPELADGDVLRLQYLNNVDADLESAQVVSEFGKALFAYVASAMGARDQEGRS